MYKPLPDSVTIKESPIHGLGLFAAEDIPKGTNLGVSHTRMHSDWLRSPLGAFYNHSEKPNCIKTLCKNQFREWMNLVVLKDIKAGEEITVEYTLYKV